MMLNENLDAGNASGGVGYESASQFNREYSRLFGAPPQRDIARMRTAGELSSASARRRLACNQDQLPLNPSGGRCWWAHFEFTRINIAPTIPPKRSRTIRNSGMRVLCTEIPSLSPRADASN